MKIVIDMMGADQGSVATVAGVLDFHKNHTDVELFCVGRASELQPLNGVAYIIDAPEVLPMTAGAMDVLRAKNSSVMTSITTMINEKADAIVGAGSTGGFLTALTIKLKLIPGVERAAIIAPFPTKIKGKKVAVLDIGASNENTSSQIVQFAKMGRIYAQKVFGVDEPKTYLLANGAEHEKGSPEIRKLTIFYVKQTFLNLWENFEAAKHWRSKLMSWSQADLRANIFFKTTEASPK